MCIISVVSQLVNFMDIAPPISGPNNKKSGPFNTEFFEKYVKIPYLMKNM